MRIWTNICKVDVLRSGIGPISSNVGLIGSELGPKLNKVGTIESGFGTNFDKVDTICVKLGLVVKLIGGKV